ncbi:Alpha/Beta hydrolase protein [Coniochaeta sp. 2T2.1]|nr:Alpha/Beta hydrolase protein [Coniochaeta sp. 2T2.1]
MPYARVNNKELFYTITAPEASAPKSALALVCIHGLGSASSFYAPITPHLTSLGNTVLAIDTHGSGLSPYSGTGNTTTSVADDALAVVESLAGQMPESVVVLGHSMGGIVASEMALRDEKDRIKGLVLIGPVNPNPGAAEAFGRRIEVVSQGGMEPLALSIPAAATGSKASPLVHAFIRALLLASSPDGYISLCRAIAEARVPDYGSIKAPLLIIAGGEDKSAPVEGSTYILEQYGSAKKEQMVLDGVGHWHVLEAYDDVAKLVGDFVGNL